MAEGQQLQLQILAQLGELGQQLGVLQAQSTHIMVEQAKGATDRKGIYDKLNEFAIVAAEVGRLTPLVDGHERKNQRAIGAVWLINALWTLGAGGLGAALSFVISRFTSGGGAAPHP